MTIVAMEQFNIFNADFLVDALNIFFEIALHRADNNVQSQSSQSAAEKRNDLCLFPDSDVSVTKISFGIK